MNARGHQLRSGETSRDPENRGLDFANVGQVFQGRSATIQDLRFDYNEDRFITVGCGRCVVVDCAPRAVSRRIISMRHAHANEEKA